MDSVLKDDHANSLTSDCNSSERVVLGEMTRSLENARQRFEEVSRKSPIAFLIHDFAGGVLESNDTARQLLGVKNGTQFCISDVLSEPALDCFQSNVDESKSLQKEALTEITLKTNDQTQLIQFATSSLTDGLFKTTLFNVSTQKDLEKIQHRLNKRTQYFQKIGPLSVLTKEVSFELNNLLQVILFQCDFLDSAIETDNDTERLEAVKAIGRVASDGVAITQRLLNFAAIDPLKKQHLCLNEPLKSESESSQQFLTGNVLVVDDQPIIAKSLASRLKEIGLNVTVANDGKEALEVIANASSGFDALVSDIVMPFVSGGEVARHFQTAFPQAKIVFISGNADSVLNHEQLKELNASVIRKPFLTEELVEVLELNLGIVSDLG